MKRTLAFVIIVIATTAFAAEPRLVPHPLPARHDECKLCHTKKQLKFMPSTHSPKKEHENYSLRHGAREMSCNACHDANSSNTLRSSRGFEASFSNPSPVCQRCHSEVYRDWLGGMHGRQTGSWKSDGEKLSRHCIDCHLPHDVSYKAMQPRPAPVKPRGHVSKEEHP